MAVSKNKNKLAGTSCLIITQAAGGFREKYSTLPKFFGAPVLKPC